MKTLLVAVATIASILIATSLYNAPTNNVKSSDVESAFNKWMMKHGKSYGNQSDKSYRLEVFSKNMSKVQKHSNNTKATYKLGLNKFADLTSQEFKKKYLG